MNEKLRSQYAGIEKAEAKSGKIHQTQDIHYQNIYEEELSDV